MNTVIRYGNGRSLFNEMDKLFDGMRNTWPQSTSRTPAVNVREDGNAYVFEAELPGMDDTDVDVTIENGRLTISSHTAENSKEQKGEEDLSYLLRERRSQQFSRSFGLPRDVDQSKIKAEFKNGLLTLTLPKAEEAKPRTIKIN